MRRIVGFLLFFGAVAGFGSGIVHLKHAHQDAPCHQARDGGWGRERGPAPVPAVQDHIHDAEGRVYVRPRGAQTELRP